MVKGISKRIASIAYKYGSLYDMIITEVPMNKKEQIRLTQQASAAGWAAKLSPDRLSDILGGLPSFAADERLIVGFGNSEDAAVYAISDDEAIITTLDFFTPIVDDPYEFGQIAAANSLSDVYAMGGEPKLCMNIVGFPEDLDMSILGDILRGGADKVIESGAMVVGGHTVRDKEPKFGLSVVGFVKRDAVLKNHGSEVGDVLILTKALGTGIVSTGIKREKTETSWEEASSFSMRYLNKYAVEQLGDAEVHACTDITGFGLLGHLTEMMEGSQTSCVLTFDSIPLLPGVLELARAGVTPGGAKNNSCHFGKNVSMDEFITEAEKSILFDPQTSGGLLLSVKKEHADALLERLKSIETPAAVIGEVTEMRESYIHVRRS